MDPTLERIYGMTAADTEAAKRHLMVGGATPGPTLIRGKGVRVQDIDGNSYIDCTSQGWALYLGYTNDEIRQVICEHAQNLTHVHQGFNSLPQLYLARRLAQLAPDSLDRVSFTVGSPG